MPKRLVCVHPHGKYRFGDEVTVNNALAATMLNTRSGAYTVWQVRKDLGADEVQPEAEAPKAETKPAEEAPKAEEAPVDEAPKAEVTPEATEATEQPTEATEPAAEEAGKKTRKK